MNCIYIYFIIIVSEIIYLYLYYMYYFAFQLVEDIVASMVLIFNRKVNSSICIMEKKNLV